MGDQRCSCAQISRLDPKRGFLGCENARTGTPIVGLESIFLKGELIIDTLDLWKVEVRLGYQNGGFRDVGLIPVCVGWGTSCDQECTELPLGIQGTFRPRLPFARPNQRYSP